MGVIMVVLDLGEPCALRGKQRSVFVRVGPFAGTLLGCVRRCVGFGFVQLDDTVTVVDLQPH